jgi:hypothetical protein
MTFAVQVILLMIALAFVLILAVALLGLSYIIRDLWHGLKTGRDWK